MSFWRYIFLVHMIQVNGSCVCICLYQDRLARNSFGKIAGRYMRVKATSDDQNLNLRLWQIKSEDVCGCPQASTGWSNEDYLCTKDGLLVTVPGLRIELNCLLIMREKC